MTARPKECSVRPDAVLPRHSQLQPAGTVPFVGRCNEIPYLRNEVDRDEDYRLDVWVISGCHAHRGLNSQK